VRTRTFADGVVDKIKQRTTSSYNTPSDPLSVLNGSLASVYDSGVEASSGDETCRRGAAAVQRHPLADGSHAGAVLVERRLRQRQHQAAVPHGHPVLRHAADVNQTDDTTSSGPRR
jgi:hypothetical protein